MSQSTESQKMLNRKEIIIAVIGLIGVSVTALLSNWDKLYPKENVITTSYTGYTQTEDPKSEFRYFMEITGVRDQMLTMQRGLLAQEKIQLAELFKDNPELLDKFYSIIDEELPHLNERLIASYIQIASQYFTLEEVQELNKFYSTPVMREMIRRQPLLAKTYIQEVGPISTDFEKRLEYRFSEAAKSMNLD